MPPAQLISTQLTDLSELLRQRHRDLTLVVDRELHAEGMSEVSVTLATDADWAAAAVEAETSIARAERDVSELSEIADALARVESGNYGTCEACGNDIGYARLLAHPAARRCLSCQQTIEAKRDSPIANSRNSL